MRHAPAEPVAIVGSPDRKRLVTGSADSTARVWDVVTGNQLLVLRGHTKWVGKVGFSADGKTIVTTGGDGSTRIWDSENGRLLAELGGHSGWVGSAVFTPDGSHVLTTGQDRTALIDPVHVETSREDLVTFAVTRVTRPQTWEERRDFLHDDSSG